MTDVRPAAAPADTRESRRNPHGSFIWYELITPDPDGAKRFYDAVMGWEVGPGSEEHGGYREIRSRGGHAGGVLPLSDEMREHGARPTWLGYIGVDDVDASARSIAEAGGKVLMPPWDIPGIGRIALVTDPQGGPFYVMRGASEEASTAFSPDEAGRCSWNELATSDAEGALDFYTRQFGWTKGDAMPMGEKGDYRFITHHEVPLGAIFPAAAGAMPDQPPKWRFYFRVPSIGQARQAVEDSGGTVAMGPHEVPGGDWILIGTDPQGAEFALVGKQ